MAHIHADLCSNLIESAGVAKTEQDGENDGNSDEQHQHDHRRKRHQESDEAVAASLTPLIASGRFSARLLLHSAHLIVRFLAAHKSAPRSITRLPFAHCRPGTS
jgi:hypothetical protein